MTSDGAEFRIKAADDKESEEIIMKVISTEKAPAAIGPYSREFDS